MIRDSRQGFEFSRLNCLLSLAVSRQDKNIKINGIISGSVTFNNMKVILTLRTLNYVDFVPFSCVDFSHIIHNRAK